MQTRSSVLGKRGHQDPSSSPLAPQACEQLQTPDNTPNPKRARTTVSVLDGDGNKENIPPLKVTPINGDTSPRAIRALRRTATEVITPTRSRPSPRRNASLASLPPSTPSTENFHLAISTPPPTPPIALLPLHARARGLLRSTCNNTHAQIAGREIERAAILDFLTLFIQGASVNNEATTSSMFISGSPGTGKTALVNAIIRELSTENITDVKVVSINCMALKGLDALWERIIEELSDGSKRKNSSKKLKGREGVRSILTELSAKCILILDELDHITPNSQSLTSIFTLTETLPAQLRLIGIANTHTLTSSSTLLPSNDVQTIHFAPYTPTQLQEILQSRLNPLSDGDSTDSAASLKKFLPPATLTLLTKKVAALTGDVRSLFEVLRGAIDLAIVASSVNKSSDENPLNTPAVGVTPQHILAALKAYTPASAAPKTLTAVSSTSSSETVTKIRNLGLQARLALLAILLASKRLEAGLALTTSTTSPRKSSASPMKRSISLPQPMSSGPGVGIETGVLHTYYSAVLSRTESGVFEPVSRSEFGDLLGMLEGVGLVSLSSSLAVTSASVSPSKGRRAFGRTASFGVGLSKNGAGAVGEVRLVEGVWGDEVLRCLGVMTADVSASDAREEEVRGIWERERVRLNRDVKAAALANTSRPDTFAGAFSD
ncbi:P-loop containing nucleoside triphosphate hydrolase protein [Gymnopilus junonius]|uniref:P-loop containing nucleoside triphosphate hydrolase protein n=1 Tax=Gymnopilus junonius TaxID=109634 RepID=A0A9P5NN85_GYMJU|nr:P-loop containing nucleoside triphosphate hydrolase protein [Gymnopilus junonius]